MESMEHAEVRPNDAPIDPGTGRRRLGLKSMLLLGFVYSIGQNGVDDNGSQHVPDPTGESEYPYSEDIVMKLLPVESTSAD